MYKRFLGIFLMGLVIKMMDDYIDKEIDLLKGQWNLSLIFKNAILPYALLLLIFSLYFNFLKQSLSLLPVIFWEWPVS